MPDNVHKMWSEGELDDAMTALYANPAVNREAQVKARAALMQAAADTPRSIVTLSKTRRVVPLAAAAAVVALVAVGAVLISQNSAPKDAGPGAQSTLAPVRPPATSGSQHAPMPPMPDKPQNSLSVLATKVTETPLAPGQYRYVFTEGLHQMRTQGDSGKPYTYLAEFRSEVWIPADQRQPWMVRNQTTDTRQWIKGTEQEARADNVRFTPVMRPDGEVKAPCGNFAPTEGNDPCEEEPVGTVRTKAGPAQPPSDPALLYQWLADDSAGHADPPLQFFRTASGMLDARFPAAIRRATLEALSRHPYLAVTDTTTHDNRPAIMASIDYADGRLREDMLLDPATGQLIGRRMLALKDVDDQKAGAKFHDSVRREAIVGKIGAQPIR